MNPVSFYVVTARADQEIGTLLARRLRRAAAAGRRLRRESDPERADWLICLLSPALVDDTVRTEEVRVFARDRGPERVLFVHVGGTLVWDHDEQTWAAGCTAMPPGIARLAHVEPRWVDLVGRGVVDASAADAAADLAAPMLGVGRRTLAGEDVRRHRVAVRVAAAVGVAAALLLVLASGGLVQARIAAKEAQEARVISVAGLAALTADRLAGEQPVLSELFAVQAWRRDHSPETRSAVLAARDRLADSSQVVTLPGCPGSSPAARPDGTDAVVCMDGTLYRWARAAAAPVRTPVSLPIGSTIWFAADGTLWATTDDGRVAHVDRDLTGVINSWAFPPGVDALWANESGSWIFAGREDGAVQAIDTKTDQLTPTVVPSSVTGGQPVWRGAASPDGSRLALLIEGDRTIVYDVPTRSVVFDHAQRDNVACFTRDGSRLLVGRDDGELVSIPLDRPSEARPSSELHDANVTEILTTSDGLATSVDVNGRVRRWNPATLDWTESLFLPLEKAAAFVIDASGTHLVGIDLHGRVARIRTHGGMTVPVFGPTGNGRIRDVGAPRDGLVGLQLGDRVELWDTRHTPWSRASGTTSATIPKAQPKSHALVPVGGTRLVYLAADGVLTLVDLRTGRVTDAAQMPDDAVLVAVPGGVAVVATGQLFSMQVVGETLQQKVIQLLDPSGRAVTAEVRAADALPAAGGGPSNQIFVTFRDGNAWRLDAVTGRATGPLLHTGVGDQVVGWSDGRHVVTGSQVGALRLWDVGTGSASGPWLSIPALVNDLVETEDHLLAVGTSAGLTVIDPRNDALVRSQVTPGYTSDLVRTVRILPGTGTLLVVTSGEAFTYDLDAGRAMQQVCAKIGRDLTVKEWNTYLPGEPYPSRYRTVCASIARSNTR